VLFIFIFLKIYLFLLERERENEWEGQRVRERERGKLKQTPRLSRSPMRSSIPQPRDHDLSRNQELEAHPTALPRHPKEVLFKDWGVATEGSSPP